MAEKGRILLVYSCYSSFVRRDHDILARRYEVETFPLAWQAGLLSRLRRTHLALLRAMRRADAVYWWFLADYSGIGASYARLLRRPFIGVAGGYDVVNDPENRYGRLAVGTRLEKASTRLALRWARSILTVSPPNDEETRSAGRASGRHLVPLGVDPANWLPSAGPIDPARRAQVVTVGAIDPVNLDIKGQHVFADVSREVPEADFIMVGESHAETAETLRRRGGPNLKILGPVPNAELASLLQGAQVVCQISRRESFGMALVEAVSCGCVPVYTDAGIGAAHYLEGLGHKVPYGDVKAAVAAVRRALGESKASGYRARAHDVVRRNLHIDLRAARVLEIVAHALDDR